MSSSSARFLKSILPVAVYSPARNWAVRLLTWRRLMAHVHGATTRDRFWLWASFVASPITATRRLSDWRDPLLLADIVADVSGIGRFKLRARTDDLWHVVPFRERAVLNYIRARLRPGDCFVDAGANIGFYTIAGAKAVGPSGTVLAVEMLAGTARILRDHIETNRADHARVFEGALSSKEGEIIVASMPSGSFGQASINDSGKGEIFEVRSTTFNEILRDVPSVRLVKIDIEGAELTALKGGSAVMDRIEAIIFEHLDSRALEEITELLSLYGFRIESLDSSNSLAVRS